MFYVIDILINVSIDSHAVVRYYREFPCKFCPVFSNGNIKQNYSVMS